LRLVAATLKRRQMSLAEQMNATVDLYNGDLIEGGRGELLVAV
jgi:hypothetical protein